MSHSGTLRVAFFVIVAAIYCGVVFAQNVSSLPEFPPGDHRNCPIAKEIYRFEVLPGGGWDNLRNQHMGFVFGKNYSQCKTSEDGKFLLPDNVNLFPVKNSKVEMFAEIYDHWNNYSSATAKSINAEATGNFKMCSVSGSFSAEFESVKKHQVEDNSVTTRVQIRHDLYIARLQPDSALQPELKSRLLEIASHLQHNNTEYANFLARLLVRDYGTHYITRVNAGAVLSKVDHLTKAFVSNFEGERSKITAAASASFFGVFGGNFSGKLSYSYSSGRQELDEYTKNMVHSTVYTYGGPPFRVDFAINRWEDQLLGELVAIDRSGDPLHYAITPGSLPEISDRLNFGLADTVKRAIELYYTRNTIKGCTKRDSPNFSFQANYDDGSCEKSTNNYTFGGVYQTCQYVGTQVGDTCQDLLQLNPLTSDYSCSDGYEAVVIHEGYSPERCRRECESCGFFWFSTCCHEYCGYAYYTTYWCVATGEVPPNTGYLFGGLYSDAVNNPVTQAHSCPLKFYSLPFGATMRVCLSDDYELSYEQSVPFGGFFSCRAGNPLGAGQSKLEKFISEPGGADWPHTCPIGYSQHLAAIEQNCQINFCVKSNVFNSLGLPIIKRPPYSKAPKILNFSVPMMLVNQDVNQTWFKSPNSPQWILATKSSVAEYKTQSNMQGHPDNGTDKGMNAGTAAGITFVVTALAGLLIAAIVIGWLRHSARKISRGDESTKPLSPGGVYGAVNSDEGNSRV